MKTNILVLATSLALATLSHAATLVDVWSSATGDWNSDGSTQSQWASSNILAPGFSQSGATIVTSSHPASTTQSPAGGLYEGYFYTYLAYAGFSLEFNSATVLDGIETLSLSFNSAGLYATLESSVSLTVYFADTSSVVVSGPAFATEPGSTLGVGTEFEMAGTSYSWTWDLSSYSAAEITSFSIDVTSGMHTAYDNFTLTQTSTVPEPATYAAFAGLGVLCLAAFRRRRRHA